MPEIRCGNNTCDYTTGDVSEEFAVLMFKSHLTQHALPEQQNNNIDHTGRTEKVKKPTVSQACTPEDWSYFESRWGDYKELTSIKEGSIVVNLMECCDEDLRKNIFRTYGSLKNNTEEEALKKIKKLAVHIENVRVARVTLHQMKQDQDDPVRGFVAKLKGQASICNYTMKFRCQCDIESDINYADEIVSNVLISGLADNQIQREILSDVNQEMSLEQMVNLIEAKEVGNRSASQVTNIVKTYAVKSTYKRDVNNTIKTQNQPSRDENTNSKDKPWHCGWCGKHGHGNYGDPQKRRRVCPAFHHTCKNCSRKGHYERSCKQLGPRQHSTSTIHVEHEGSSSDPEVLMGAIHHRQFSQGQ